MDSIFEAALNIVLEIVKFIVYVVIWCLLLFYIGVLILKVLTLLKYPAGNQLTKHVNVISGVGLNSVFIAWSSIATYNNSENLYLLVFGIVVFSIQFIFVAFKYLNQDRTPLKM